MSEECPVHSEGREALAPAPYRSCGCPIPRAVQSQNTPCIWAAIFIYYLLKNFQRRRLGGKRSRPCSEGAKSSRSGSPATGPARGLSLPAPSGQAAISAARPGSGRGGRRRSAPPHPERAARGQARHGPGEAGVAAMPGCRSPPAFSCSTFPHARFLKSPLLFLWGSRLRCRCGIPSPSCGCPVSLSARLSAALPARLPAPPALPVSSV